MILNPSNEHIEAVVSVKNVTELVQSEQVVSMIASTEFDAILTIDVKTNELHQFVSPESNAQGARRFQYLSTTEQFEDYLRANCCGSTDAERVICEMKSHYIAKQLETVPTYTVLYNLLENGEARYKRNLYTFLDTSHRTLLCARQDITEIYRKEEEQKEKLEAALRTAQTASRAKTDFLSTVSHDMRTPLNGILGLAHLLIDRETDPEKCNDLKQLADSGQYLLNLINDTLDVSKIESGKLELHPRVAEGKSIVTGVLAIVRQSFIEKKIDFQMHMGELPFTKLYVDIGRIEQVLINIIGNAIKFTPAGGRIDFTMRNLSVENGIIKDEVIIRDTGIGMSKDFLDHIFEPFSQEYQNTKTKYTGTGLGMTITKRIVEMMGGEISVESQLGKGTTVRVIVCMPIATEEQIRRAEMSLPSPADPAKRTGIRVLLCEDHPLNAQIAMRLLKKKGILVDHAENGQIGCEKFLHAESGYYQMILMDVRMPVMDGYEATEAIRSSTKVEARTIPILAMTANAFDSDIQECLKRGMNAHIAKPIDPDTMFNVMAEELAKVTPH